MNIDDSSLYTSTLISYALQDEFELYKAGSNGGLIFTKLKNINIYLNDTVWHLQAKRKVNMYYIEQVHDYLFSIYCITIITIIIILVTVLFNGFVFNQYRQHI